MNKTALIYFVLALIIHFSALADAYDDQIRVLEQKIAECQAEINKDYAEIQQLRNENASSFRIEAVEKDIWMYENSIKSYQDQISYLRKQQAEAAYREQDIRNKMEAGVKKAQQQQSRQKADYETQRKALEEKIEKENQAELRALQKAEEEARDEAERRERQLKYEQKKAEQEAKKQQAIEDFDRKHGESWRLMSELADERAEEMPYLREQVSVTDAKKAFTAGSSEAKIGNQRQAASSQQSKKTNLSNIKKAAQAAQSPQKSEEKPKPSGKWIIPQPKYD